MEGRPCGEILQGRGEARNSGLVNRAGSPIWSCVQDVSILPGVEQRTERETASECV